MTTLIRTDSDHEDFKYLITFLDRELSERDGDEHSFYAQFNTVDEIKHVVVAYIKNEPVGCGSIKAFDKESVEIKRMYVANLERRKGVAQEILAELEQWAAELGFERCVLETGTKQPEAIALYQKLGYSIMPNYGQYAGVENSVCMQKNAV
jgi:putative acetyltransferase